MRKLHHELKEHLLFSPYKKESINDVSKSYNKKEKIVWSNASLYWKYACAQPVVFLDDQTAGRHNRGLGLRTV